MPLDRTLFDLWVDEPPGGDGSTGTKLTKARLASDLLDVIDAALAAGGVAGATTQVMFNDAGVMAGDAGLVYNKTTDALTAGSLVATLGQIVFPATQNASANANTLDDYEEQLFTPGLTFGGGSTGMTFGGGNQGFYVKWGRNVIATGYLQLTAKGSSTGAAALTGLPFTSSGVAKYVGVGGAYANLASLVSVPLGVVVASTTTIALYNSGAASVAALTHANFTDSSELQFFAFYLAAN